MNIYHLECSVNDSEHSLTRKYSRMIVKKLLNKYPDSKVNYIDLMKEEIPFLSKTYETAMFKPEKDRTPEERKALESFDITPFVESDIYVLGVPAYFFNVPARFKNWFEHLFRIDTTLTPQWVGMLENRKLYIVSAWGGIYSNTDIEHSYETFITKSFNLFGINNITFYNIFRDEETDTDNIEAIERVIENSF